MKELYVCWPIPCRAACVSRRRRKVLEVTCFAKQCVVLCCAVIVLCVVLCCALCRFTSLQSLNGVAITAEEEAAAGQLFGGLEAALDAALVSSVTGQLPAAGVSVY